MPGVSTQSNRASSPTSSLPLDSIPAWSGSTEAPRTRRGPPSSRQRREPASRSVSREPDPSRQQPAKATLGVPRRGNTPLASCPRSARPEGWRSPGAASMPCTPPFGSASATRTPPTIPSGGTLVAEALRSVHPPRHWYSSCGLPSSRGSVPTEQGQCQPGACRGWPPCPTPGTSGAARQGRTPSGTTIACTPSAVTAAAASPCAPGFPAAWEVRAVRSAPARPSCRARGYSNQSATKTLVSPRVFALRLEAHSSFFPSGLNIGKPSNSGSNVTCSRPVPSRWIR